MYQEGGYQQPPPQGYPQQGGGYQQPPPQGYPQQGAPQGYPQQSYSQQAGVYPGGGPGYASPMAYAVPPGGTGLLAGGYTGEVPVATPLPAPIAVERPVWDGKRKDVAWGVLFVVHVLAIIVVAFALGIPAVKDDSARPENDPNRSIMDFNAYTFLKVIAVAATVSAVAAIACFQLMRRCGGAMIKISLYASAAIMLAVAVSLMAVSVIAGGIMLIPVALILLFICLARKRIPFAAAHLQAACDAVNDYPNVRAPASNCMCVGMWGTTTTTSTVYRLALSHRCARTSILCTPSLRLLADLPDSAAHARRAVRVEHHVGRSGAGRGAQAELQWHVTQQRVCHGPPSAVRHQRDGHHDDGGGAAGCHSHRLLLGRQRGRHCRVRHAHQLLLGCAGV